LVGGFDAELAARGLEARVVPPAGGDVEVEADPPGSPRFCAISSPTRPAMPFRDRRRGAVHRLSTGVRVEVVDNGEEIAVEVVPFGFERFVRADPSRGRDSGVSGIVPAVVKELVEAHGGWVGARSGAGMVTAWFELPARPAERPQFVPQSAETAVSGGVPATGR
jgi:signal transduction histidine kinase